MREATFVCERGTAVGSKSVWRCSRSCRGAFIVSCDVLPDSAPLSSYREKGGAVRVVKYSRALSALRDVLTESGRDPRHYGLHSLRVEGATVLASGGDISERVIQREGKWSSDVHLKQRGGLPTCVAETDEWE